MEIKILCGCGAKYKFDVEPVHGQMPKAIRCPVCSADGTAQANELIRQQSANPAAPVAVLLASNVPVAAPPLPSTPATAPASIPPAPPLPPTSSPPAVPRIALRVGQSAEVSADAPPAAPYEGPFPLRRGAVVGGLRSQHLAASTMASPTGGVREVKLGFKAWGLILLFLAVVIGWPVAKWYFRAKREGILAGVFKNDSKRGQTADGKSSEEAAEQHNFLADESTVLVVRHSNDVELAQACVEFWRDKLRRKMTLVPMKDGLFEQGQIGVKAPHRGWVQMDGPAKWPKPQAEALLAHLTQKFGATGVIMADFNDGEDFLFAVYETGQKQFRAEYSLRRNDGDTATEGREWARKIGYKPDGGDWASFEADEADMLMGKMGLKLGGGPDLVYTHMLKQ